MFLLNQLCFSLIIAPIVVCLQCPELWKSYSDFCYTVPSTQWAEDFESAQSFCEAFSNSESVGGLLSWNGRDSFTGYSFPKKESGFWLGVRKFHGYFYDVLTEELVSFPQAGYGNCLLLHQYMQDKETHYDVLATECDGVALPFICALYDRSMTASDRDIKKRSTVPSCSGKQNNLNKCRDATLSDCERPKYKQSCALRCCELRNSDDPCLGTSDSYSKCEQRKNEGRCQEYKAVCAKTCCGQDTVSVSTTVTAATASDTAEFDCSPLFGSDTQGALACFTRAYVSQECDTFPDPLCPFTCCLADTVELPDILTTTEITTTTTSTVTTTTGTDTVTGAGSPVTATNTGSVASTTVGPSTTPAEVCSALTDEKVEFVCGNRVLTDRCEEPHLETLCRRTCCFSRMPPTTTGSTVQPCHELSDTLLGGVCPRRAARGHCDRPIKPGRPTYAVFCQLSCCMAGITTVQPATSTPSVTGTGTGLTTLSGVTQQSSTLGLCGEFHDVGVGCARRVRQDKCEDLVNEVKCRYSCCLDVMEAPLPASTALPTTTQSPVDSGLDQCNGLSDIAPSAVCVSIVSGGLCGNSITSAACRLTCCRYDVANDEEEPESPVSVGLSSCASGLVDYLPYSRCLEVYMMNECNFFSCEETCCESGPEFDGSPCNSLLDVNDAFCMIHCYDECELTTVCDIYCPRTICLYCYSEVPWEESTSAPHPCTGLTNDKSPVYCAQKVTSKDCPAYSGGIYDAECNFACCVQNPSISKRSLSVELRQNRQRRDTEERVVGYPKRFNVSDLQIQTDEFYQKACMEDKPTCVDFTGLINARKRRHLDVGGVMKFEPSWRLMAAVLVIMMSL